MLSALLLVAGCSSITGDPREKANNAVAEANDSIAKHNKLFEKARNTYADVKKKVESGGDPSKEKNDITQAKNTLQDARGNLQDARHSLNSVQDLDVDSTVKKYASLLSDAMDAQISAEAKEIQFYGILEKDPALKDHRKDALDILSQVSNGYKKAEDAYGKARDLANKNPKVLGPASKSPKDKANKSGS